MTSGGFLRVPRVRVKWGDINLSAYDGPKYGAPEVFSSDSEKGGPIVYDVQADLNAENEGPTAEMKWDPTGPGMAAYEWFVSQDKYMKTQISIEFFYPQGKKIVLYYAWSGQSINYGNDMAITVKMQSELSGLVNSNVRNTAQAYDEKKGATPIDVIDKSKAQFGLDKYADIVEYNKYTEEYLKKVKLLNAYGNDWTFGNSVAQIAKQTGDMAFAHNIGKAGVVLMPPYSWKDPKGKEQDILNAATDIPAGQAPDPKIRYGYILGPSIFNSITRTSNWKPPQQDNNNTPGSQVRARDPQTGQYVSQNPPTSPQVAESNTTAAAKKTSAPLGTANNRSNLGVQNKDNPYGPDRQNALNDEKGSELQMDTLLCPLLVGVKPHDIVFVPSLTGKYIEDWVVQSVGYSQNDGQINVNIRATRVFGQGTPMNKAAAEKFKQFAKDRGLIGPNATPENWDKYAWSLPGEQ